MERKTPKVSAILVLVVLLAVSVVANFYLISELRSRAETSARAEGFALYFAGSMLEAAARHLERAVEAESERDVSMELIMADNGILAAHQFMQVLRLDIPDSEVHFVSGLFEAMFRALRELSERDDPEIAENLLLTTRHTGRVIRDISTEIRAEGTSGGVARDLYIKMTAQIEESLREEEVWQMLVNYVPYLQDARR